MTPKELALIAVKALDEKKGKEISAIEVTHLTTLADFFVIATGTSNTQINALCGAVEKAVKEQAGAAPLHRSGYRDGTWVLLDYGCLAVHVFSSEAREFYALTASGPTESPWTSVPSSPPTDAEKETYPFPVVRLFFLLLNFVYAIRASHFRS